MADVRPIKKLRLEGFNNLTKSLSFNIYDVCYAKSEEEKEAQIAGVRNFQAIHADESCRELDRLKEVARRRGNCFEALMESVKHASLGQVSDALYNVGGEYRRNM